MKATIAAVVFGFGALGVAIAAQITHVIICLKAGEWLFAAAGIIAAPVGVIHGIGHWVGAW